MLERGCFFLERGCFFVRGVMVCLASWSGPDRFPRDVPWEFKWLRPCRRPLEFNYNVGSNLGLFGSRRAFNGRGAPLGCIWAEFQLKRSHGDPFHAQNSRFFATGSNSGAPGAQEISPLTSGRLLNNAACPGAHIYLVFASNRAMATCFVTKTFPILS